jgi:carboxymethylenebutenolidase
VLELKDLPVLEEMASRARMLDLMASINIPKVMDDSDALFKHADHDPAASPGPAAAIGYCMSGQYAINAAARAPERIACAASIYGVQLVTDAEDSPHRVAKRTKAEFYIACAEHDMWAPLAMVQALTTALKADGVNAEVEIYPGVHHGFAFAQRGAIYNKAAAERHWERLFALFARNLA